MSTSESFSEREMKILKALYNNMGYMPTKKVSLRTGYAWETCLPILEDLNRQGYILIREGKIGDKIIKRWKFNYKRHKKLRDYLKKEKQMRRRV